MALVVGAAGCKGHFFIERADAGGKQATQGYVEVSSSGTYFGSNGEQKWMLLPTLADRKPCQVRSDATSTRLWKCADADACAKAANDSFAACKPKPSDRIREFTARARFIATPATDAALNRAVCGEATALFAKHKRQWTLSKDLDGNAAFVGPKQWIPETRYGLWREVGGFRTAAGQMEVCTYAAKAGGETFFNTVETWYIANDVKLDELATEKGAKGRSLVTEPKGEATHCGRALSEADQKKHQGVYIVAFRGPATADHVVCTEDPE